MKKNCLFQYYNGQITVVDTELITRKEADRLFDKHEREVREGLKEGFDVQMGIWINCKTNTDYHTLDKKKDIDYMNPNPQHI